MRKIAWFVLCGLLLLQEKTIGQTASSQSFNGDAYDTSAVIGRDRILERLFDRSREAEGSTDLLEQLSQLKRKKINVNTASFDQLLEIPFLSAYQVQAIIAYRTSHGSLEDLSELSPVLGEESVEVISNFLVAELPKEELSGDASRSSRLGGNGFEYVGRTVLEMPERQGFQNGAYLGTEPKLYNRMQAAFYDKYFFSALIEKDIGEQSIADFSSISFQASGLSNIKRIVVGDYNLRFGQGLAIASGRFFFKGGETVLATKLTGSQLSAYSSTAEQNFFRGVAAQVDFGTIGLTGFYSRNYFDATLTDTGYSSIRYDGLHRTASEIEKKDDVIETLYGLHLDFNYPVAENYWHVGSTFYSGYYDKKAVPELDLENRYRFSGTKFTVSSVDADMMIGRFNVFGEYAYSVEQKAASWIAGLNAALQKNVKAAILVRDYDKAFFSPHATAFAEDGEDARNEFGVYFGVEARLAKELQVRVYYDVFKSPFIDANTVMPASGDDIRLELSYSLTKKLAIEMLLQRKNSEEALTQTDVLGQGYRTAVPILSERIRTELIYRLSEQVRLKTRSEVKHVRKTYLAGDENLMGWLVYEQLEFDSKDRRFSAEARISVFDTDSYDAAIYTYENDLPLLITVSALSGTGRRLLLNLRYQILSGIELAFRYANTFYDSAQTVGSGNDKKETNSPSLVSFGLRARF